jgi:hypothetical protein
MPSNPVTRESILAAIRIAIKKSGGKRIIKDAFLEQSGIKYWKFHKHFGGWNEALREAGFNFEPGGVTLDPERLLADWGATARKLARVPSIISYQLHGKFTGRPFRERFGSWAGVLPAFRNFASDKKEWADVLALCDAHSKIRRTRARIRKRRPRRMRTRPFPGAINAIPLSDRPIYGEPLHLQGISTAPVNENGVILLFGKIGWALGFQVESIHAAFPDCEARRQVGNGQWQPVTIEFEYESRNFALHGHDPKGCDLIVCWNHNWPECPKNLEVIALKDELQRLYPGNPTKTAATGNSTPQ